MLRTYALHKLPGKFPNYVPSTGSNIGQYVFSDISAWTSGFFPGSMYELLERSVRFPDHLKTGSVDPEDIHDQLLELSRQWAKPLQTQAFRTNTHDMGFLIMPAFQKDWELTGNQDSLDTIVTAAHSLATRFDPRVKAVRSWDSLVNKRQNITNKETNFLVIIDSMCNMDLLFYAGHHTGNQTLIDIATTHAHTVRRNIVRKNYSTFHCCNIDPQNDKIKFQETVQGYKDWSTWSRGQAWGILGYVQTYRWTKDAVFLQTARGLADYFVNRLSKSSHTHPYVPLWDFDAPTVDGVLPPRDTSAGLVAANGLLLLHQALQGESPYLDHAIQIVRETIELSLSHDPTSLTLSPIGKTAIPAGNWDSVLMNATINNNEYSLSRSNNTGVVYADYYFLQFGNRLLEMALA
ncbi:uncharacterized protein N7446_000609 [Penicillium canescens]|uniref:Glycoside hydrolase family 88 protein n=1 Tax=Penicillium canescens TaxID=5083 RepID=A0AAD6I455_PENCN|nr:uncharacterized protein N7446_000609 [Penicillium canescens]KAJ6030330.1 hypothetical protein N7460_010596 [Penicillium canescens]KAJ6060702.1 hypothetical protein N7444_002556 [Penicillium canescens]KAJ6077673.1 hypothetical protein N7446_000609 [Penicillium canescens]